MPQISRRNAIVAGLTAGAAPVIGGTRIAQAAPSRSASSSRLVMQLADDLKRHAAFGIKRSGSPGDRATAQWISRRLTKSGFSVETDAFDVPFFDPKVATLSFAGGPTFNLFVQPVTITTAPHGMSAPVSLVHSVYDTPGTKGSIAVIVLPYARHAVIFSRSIVEQIDGCVKAGARAIVVVPTGPTGEVIGLNTRLHPMAPIPVVTLAPKHLPDLLKARSAKNSATLTVSGKAGMQPTWNLIATRKRGASWLVLSTPRSGWFTCAGERGTGTATFLELCDWAARAYPHLSIMAMNTGGHELDFAGLYKALRVAPPPEHTKMWAHIGAALAARDSHVLNGRVLNLLDTADPQRVLMVPENLLDVGARQFAGITALDTPIKVIPGAGELGDIVKRGYKNTFAVLGIHRWMHTPEDTIDKVSADLLLPVHEAHRRMIAWALA